MKIINEYDPLALGARQHVNNVKYMNKGLKEASTLGFKSILLSDRPASDLLIRVMSDPYLFRLTGLKAVVSYLDIEDVYGTIKDPQSKKVFIRKTFRDRMEKDNLKVEELVNEIVEYHMTVESGMMHGKRPGLSWHYYITNGQVISNALFHQFSDGTWKARRLVNFGLPVPIHCTCCSSRRKLDDVLEAELELADRAMKGQKSDPGYMKHVEACSPLRMNAFTWGIPMFWRVKDSKNPKRSGWTGRIVCNACYMRATRDTDGFITFLKAATGPVPKLAIPLPDVTVASEIDTSGERDNENIPPNSDERTMSINIRESELIAICKKNKLDDLLTTYTRKNGKKAVKLKHSRADTQETLELLGLLEVN